MRRFGCSGAMRMSMERDALAKGEWHAEAGEGDAKGESGRELTRRRRSVIEPLRGTVCSSVRFALESEAGVGGGGEMTAGFVSEMFSYGHVR